jgi:threonine dehydratase
MTASPLDIPAEVLAAEERIRPYIRETPLEASPVLVEGRDGECFIKLENLQHTGSFKARGALNKMLTLEPEALEQGVLSASTGNHGAAVAFAARAVGTRATIYVPKIASPTKVAAIERLGAEVRFVGDDGIEAEAAARRESDSSGRAYLSPYNDAAVVGGQGTIGIELERQIESIDRLYVSVGGGGLIAGVAGYLKARAPQLEVIGCSPENSSVMRQSVAAGEILDLESLPTLSDGTAGGVETDSITLQACVDLVDRWVDVSEAEISQAMRLFMNAHHQMIEGSAGVAMAAYLRSSPEGAAGRSVLISCGANIALDTLRAVLEEGE